MTAITQGTDILTELNTAVATYPETNVVLELVEVEFDEQQSETLNVRERGGFRVKITNNGLMNLLNVTLKIKGLNGALVSDGTALAEFADEFISREVEKVNGDGGSELAPSAGKFQFQAPSDDSDGEVVELFKAVLHDWNADLNRILNAHSDPLPTVNVTYSNEVFPD